MEKPGLAPRSVTGHADAMTSPPQENRFRTLPEPVRPEDRTEMVDTTVLPPLDDQAEDRAQMLRLAGGV
jgi:hypothetical protein